MSVTAYIQITPFDGPVEHHGPMSDTRCVSMVNHMLREARKDGLTVRDNGVGYEISNEYHTVMTIVCEWES